jgi:hypothetical protein
VIGPLAVGLRQNPVEQVVLDGFPREVVGGVTKIEKVADTVAVAVGVVYQSES